MSVGILTFHRASNYGAVLQAYALQEALRGLGAEVQIVDYRVPKVEFDHSPRTSFRKFGILKGARHLPAKVRKRGIFQAFCKRALELGEPCPESRLRELTCGLDALVVGSDQVWSEAFAALDPNLFLCFAERDRRYSYAASFGVPEPGGRLLRTCRAYLPEFRGISLRERSGADFVRGRLGLEARVDVDPTLLLDGAAWEGFCDAPRESGYVLVYTVGAPLGLIERAKELSARTGRELVYLNNGYANARDVRHVRFVTPERFVGWFANAAYVLTNSFHGTAFALNLRKELFVEAASARGVNNRSLELLDACGMGGRVLPGPGGRLRLAPCDWDGCHRRLAALRASSEAYLARIASGGAAGADDAGDGAGAGGGCA